ncbi:MAG: PAS domain S-box protein [Syntrophales bacterium]|jgi:PAS domain S-box-containing protein|nr:PAS domain S-box protein [Syntrophales bacterium]
MISGLRRKAFGKISRQAGLKTRLIIMVLAIAVLILVTSAIFISTRALSIMEQNAQTQLLNANRQLGLSVSLWLDTQIKTFQYFISQNEMSGMNPARQKLLLKKMAAAYPYMYLLSTTDLRGMNVARSDDKRPIDYRDRSWFQQARKGGPVTFESVISRTINRPGLVVSMPIKNGAGSIVGVGMFAMDLDNLSRQVQVPRLGKTGSAYLVDNRNRVIAHPDPAFFDSFRDLSSSPPITALRRGEKGLITFRAEDDKEWFAQIDLLNNGWGVVVQQQKAEVLSNIIFFRNMTLTIICGALLILVIASWWAIRRALLPIDVLTEAVTDLTFGNFSDNDLESVRSRLAAIRNRGDEIGTLADSFSRMAKQLRETLSSLQHELLEHKRADRELEKERNILSTILENDPSGIVLIDRQGAFQYLNPAVTSIIGYTAEDFAVVREWQKQAFPDNDYLKKVRAFWREKKNSPGRRGDAEFTVACKDGQEREIEFRTIFIKEGEITVLNDVTERKRAVEKIRQKNAQLRELTWEMAELEENNRKIISRELHDRIGQNLAILGLNINMLKTLLPEKYSEQLHSRITDSLAIVKQTTDSIRNLMEELRSPVLDDYGLEAAIRLYGEQCASRAGIRVAVQINDAVPRLSQHIENAMFRIVQEALTNVIKHAQATEAVITITVGENHLHITVADNGVGYKQRDREKRSEHWGWGLSTMVERAIAVGGAGDITSVQGKGTRVSVEVPL